MTVELNVYGDIVPWKFPRVEVQPVIRYFYLESVDNLLLEDTISVTQAISPGRVIQRGHAVKETCSEPAEAAVTESSVMLLRYNILNAEAEILETSYGSRLAVYSSAEKYSYLVPHPSSQR